jgi:cytochrome c-type biogenesis protein CcmH
VTWRLAVPLALVLLPAAVAAAAGAGPAPDDGTRTLLAASDVAQVAGAPRGTPLSGRQLERRTEAIGELLRCPVCQGMSISDSPASLAKQMKQLVRAMLAAGYDEQQVLDYFRYSYGEFVLLRPEARGIGWLLWGAPPAALLLGLAALAWRMRRTSGRRDAATADAEAASATLAPVAGSDDDGLGPYLERVRRMADRVEAPRETRRRDPG